MQCTTNSSLKLARTQNAKDVVFNMTGVQCTEVSAFRIPVPCSDADAEAQSTAGIFPLQFTLPAYRVPIQVTDDDDIPAPKQCTEPSQETTAVQTS